MAWIFAAVVLVLMVYHRGFRGFALGLGYWLIAASVSGIAALYAATPDGARQAFIWTMIVFWIVRGGYLGWKKERAASLPVLQPPTQTR